MRKIEFRGKLKSRMPEQNGQWKFGFLWTEGDNFLIGKNMMFCGIVYPETVGQFIGLLDRNETKIFEGDIIRYCPKDEYALMQEWDEKEDDFPKPNFWTKGVVEWQSTFNYPAFDLDKHFFELNALAAIFEEGYAVEVIGNIYDNPEFREAQ